MEKFRKLREKHPRFIYDSYKISKRKNNLEIRYKFILEPDIVFNPKISVPIDSSFSNEVDRNLIFHIGLIESISYWKLACSPKFIVKAEYLTKAQREWWRDLAINGLGEFFYKNNIDFTQSSFLSISTDKRVVLLKRGTKSESLKGDLVLVSGGKDTAVTLELLKGIDSRKGVLMLNPLKAGLDNVRIAKYKNLVIVKRTIDAKLLELNNKGYLNGHTPFSAYLAFLSLLVAKLYKYKQVITSNERSADEENLLFHRLKVNHQYSKSFDFEKKFRQYYEEYLTKNINYFSFLRPLYNLQVSQLFANIPQYHKTFRSCNKNSRQNTWCGKCSKCASVFLSLFPFLPVNNTIDIFGENYFFSRRVEKHIKSLIGLESFKPFECVGTKEESILAVALSIEKYRSDGNEAPKNLLTIFNNLKINHSRIRRMSRKVLNGWNNDNFLPLKYGKILRNALKHS